MKKTNKVLLSFISVLVMILLSVGLVAPGGAASAQEQQPLAPDGGLSTDLGINGPPTPPPGTEGQRAAVEIIPAADKILSVPTYTWVYGCSSVSAAMIAGYYDRNGYPNMYTGPTSGGLMPMLDSSWPMWSDGYGGIYPNNPLIASHNGIDGRTTRGSIDDYWVAVNSSADDPFITNAWPEHTWGSAIGDYMKTSQSRYNSVDGNTWFYLSGTSAKLTCSAMETQIPPGETRTKSQLDGTYGRKLFYQAKGYTVTDCYNQYTDNAVAGGFSLANYKAEIDAGRPVLLNLQGHSIVGVGYSTTSNTIYIHDTWDTSNHTMTWGGSYANMPLVAVSVVNLAPLTTPTPISPSGTIMTTTPAFTWTRVKNATQYRFQVLQGATVKYTQTVATSSCGSNAANCTNKPTTPLPPASYSWKVQAYVGGLWKPYSAAKVFSVPGINSQFNGNAANWVKRPGAAWNLGGGTTYWTTGQANLWSSASYNKNFNNFTYQARMKRVDALNDGYGWSSGLVIRGTPTFDSYNGWLNAYEFSYVQFGYGAPTGSFSVWKTVGGTWTALKGWTSSSAIAQNGWNTLKVAANGSVLKFYINNVLVWSGTDSTFTSGQVGLAMMRSNSERLDVDWAKLSPGTSTFFGAEAVEPGQNESTAADQSPYGATYVPEP